MPSVPEPQLPTGSSQSASFPLSQEGQENLLLELCDMVAKNPDAWPELRSKLAATKETKVKAPVPAAAPSAEPESAVVTYQVTARSQPKHRPATGNRPTLHIPGSGPRPASAPVATDSTEDRTAPVSTAGATERPRTLAKAGIWTKMGGRSLMIAVLVHIVLLVIGALWIFQIIHPPEKKVDFMPPGGGGGERGAEKVAVKKLKQITPTTNVKRVFAEGAVASYAIPEQGDNFGEMSALSSLDGGATGGLGGSGSGSGFGKGDGNGAGTGLGAGVGKLFGPAGLFGGKGEREGIQGSFIDFKLKREGKPTGEDPRMENYGKILQAFKRGGWNAQQYPHYSPATTLTSKFFSFPVMQDRLAGPAFESKDSGPGLWVAHYRGRITASVPGKYRFVGYGDNLLAVKIGRKLVLDASNIGFFGGDAHEQVGSGTDHPSRALPIFAGEWLNFGTGEEEIEIVMGDQGGLFCAGLYIQPKDTPLKIESGFPKLPLFLTGPVTEEERKLLKLVPDEALNGPFFPAKISSKPKI